MINIGLDAHKSTHVAVAVDDAGQVCGQWSGPNSAAGWTAVLQCAQGIGAERRWGIEGCRDVVGKVTFYTTRTPKTGVHPA